MRGYLFKYLKSDYGSRRPLFSGLPWAAVFYIQWFSYGPNASRDYLENHTLGSLCWSAFYHCDNCQRWLVNLKEERIFWLTVSGVYLIPLLLGLWLHSASWQEHMAEEVHSLFGSRNQRGRAETGIPTLPMVDLQWPNFLLQGFISFLFFRADEWTQGLASPLKLRSIPGLKASFLQGSTTSQQSLNTDDKQLGHGPLVDTPDPNCTTP